jgi:hypothetical protein
MYTKDQRIAQIDAYYRQIEILVNSFQASCNTMRFLWDLTRLIKISALLNIQNWHAQDNSARAADQDELVSRLDDLERNQKKLVDTLDMWLVRVNEFLAYTANYADAQQSNFMAIMASLQRRLQHRSLHERERQFYSSSLQHISVMSGSHVELESWMITSYDVDFGQLIGSGGL